MADGACRDGHLAAASQPVRPAAPRLSIVIPGGSVSEHDAVMSTRPPSPLSGFFVTMPPSVMARSAWNVTSPSGPVLAIALSVDETGLVDVEGGFEVDGAAKATTGTGQVDQLLRR